MLPEQADSHHWFNKFCSWSLDLQLDVILKQKIWFSGTLVKGWSNGRVHSPSSPKCSFVWCSVYSELSYGQNSFRGPQKPSQKVTFWRFCSYLWYLICICGTLYVFVVPYMLTVHIFLFEVWFLFEVTFVWLEALNKHTALLELSVLKICLKCNWNITL